MKRFGLHINAVNGQCKCSPFRLQCLLFALTSVFLVKRERFIMSCLFVCSLLSVAFFFFLFDSVLFSYQVFKKIKISVSGLEKKHKSRFCFVSR